MPHNVASLIGSWFVNHMDDGEFQRCERRVPYTVVGPSEMANPIIYVTKPVIMSRVFEDFPDVCKFGMLGRCGLPSDTDVGWFNTLLGAHPTLFLGDMDPVDLLIFAWLRASLHPKDVKYVGINDCLVRSVVVDSPDLLILPCTASERQSLELLEAVLPDLDHCIGSQSLAILKRGGKLEIEGLVNTNIQRFRAALHNL